MIKRKWSSTWVCLLAVLSFVLINVSPASADDPFPSYCSSEEGEDCLKLIKVRVKGRCDPGEGQSIFVKLRNPNDVDAPYSVRIFKNGAEFFEDIDFAPPGKSNKSYHPSAFAQWRVLVSWEDHVFADKTFSVCNPS